MHHVTCFDLQTAVPTATGDISNCSYKANTSLTVTFRWKHWVMFIVICGVGWGETRGSVETVYQAYCSTGWGGSLMKQSNTEINYYFYKVTVMIFVCWELRKGSVMSCAVRRLIGIVSVNVLMGHQVREIVFGAVWEWATENSIIFIVFPIPTERMTICSLY